MSAGFEIRPFHESDLDAVVELSLRAWTPVFESLRDVLGDPIFDRLHEPNWRAVQAEAVRWVARATTEMSSSPSPASASWGSPPSRSTRSTSEWASST